MILLKYSETVQTTNLIHFFADDCKVKADIVLLIDGSGSISKLGKKLVGSRYYLRKVYPAIMQLIGSLPISEDNIHLGFVFFGADNLEKVVEEEVF